MEKPRAEVFANAADKLEARSTTASDKDDPKWLQRSARVYRKWAAAKEKVFEYKQQQKKRKRT